MGYSFMFILCYGVFVRLGLLVHICFVWLALVFQVPCQEGGWELPAQHLGRRAFGGLERSPTSSADCFRHLLVHVILVHLVLYGFFVIMRYINLHSLTYSWASILLTNRNHPLQINCVEGLGCVNT